VRRKVAVLALPLALAFAASASADVFDDNPAAATLGAGNVYVFARAADGGVLERHTVGGGWSEWSAVPGLKATSGPAAATYVSTIQVFARQDETTIAQASLQQGQWSGPVTTYALVASALGAVQRRGTDELDVVARGTDNAVWQRAFTPGASNPWSSWVGFGGNFTSAPAIVSWSNNLLDVFTRGPDGSVQTNYMGNGSWSATFTVPGGLTIVGAPASVSQAAGQFDLFVRGPDNGLYQKHDSNGVWEAWKLVDSTALESSPAAASDQVGRIYVFARVGGQIAYKVWTGVPSPAWTAWQPLGVPVLPAPPPAPASPGPVIAPGPAPLAAIAAIIGFTYRASARQTRMTTLTLKSIPKGSTVTVTCKKGCSAKSYIKRNSGTKISLARFIRRPLRVGTVITVVVSHPGSVTSVKTLRVRARKAPSVTTACLPPSASRPQAC
jgi:hypothetical protein